MATKLTVFNIKADIGERLAKTFVQAGLAGLSVDAVTGADIAALQVAALAGAAAVVSLVMNLLLAWANPQTGGSAL